MRSVDKNGSRTGSAPDIAKSVQYKKRILEDFMVTRYKESSSKVNE
jgi:hypothetical protein